MNILIYDDQGCSATSIAHLKSQLTRFLSPCYSIQSVSAAVLANEPWEEYTAAVVIPGGRDLPYLHSLRGTLIARLKRYIFNGGRYLGVCAGAYFACKRVEFAVGDESLAIVGDRPLNLIDALAVGPALPNFQYNSERGAHLAEVEVEASTHKHTHTRTQAHDKLLLYLNGGCAFDIGSTSTQDTDTDTSILATYSHNGSVAALQRRYGNGRVVVTGVHPEFSLKCPPASLVAGEQHLQHLELDQLEQARIAHLRTLLNALALHLKPIDEAKPVGLLPMLLVGSSRGLCEWVATVTEGRNNAPPSHPTPVDSGSDEVVIHGSGFNEHVERERIAHTRADVEAGVTNQTKHIYIHALDAFNKLPPHTPKFDTAAYLALLQSVHAGRLLLYGEAVGSTQTLLDRNTRMLRSCPHGFLALASHQVAGRGRGGNAWVSSSGCLQFSLVLRLSGTCGSRVVFVQYLIGLAVVQALRAHDPSLDIALKWPNDIYATRYNSEGAQQPLKIGGILTTSHFIDGQFILIAGAGVNISNSQPTTCINDIASTPFTSELACALIMNRIDEMWGVFEKSESGFGEYLDDYYNAWMHNDQEITLQHTGQKVRIAGLTLDHGYLRTYPDIRCPVTPKSLLYNPIDLQPDGNSFDMLSGLIKVKK
ncbi:hypothetical protein E3P86_02819 [Wallemia ichthyophaga]|uniref:BPL/LPL catalytic domain-containing protein n=1 Tax=Wallemia ichthyophaga TaxID=245174 RepID=A0A4T0IW89_WALIC|nr:hypothetical protein E3P86_02819 [Wallemia ichthyophaga]